MNPIIDALVRKIPRTARETSQGYVRINCPVCGDKKARGGLRLTETGGFRYNCKNAGCEFVPPGTGWEPGGGFFGRPRRFFEAMGGSVSDIPVSILLSRPAVHAEVPRYDPAAGMLYGDWLMSDESAVRLHPKAEIATKFPEVPLPPDSRFLFDRNEPRPAANEHQRACQAYALGRGMCFVEQPLVWSPAYPRHVIIPLQHRGTTVGWIGRRIDAGSLPHLKCQDFPKDYMLHQDRAYERDYVIVQEGAFDALALDTLCSFGNVLSHKQINFLKQINESGRRVILLPDFKDNEWQPYWNAAAKNNWYLSVPTYPYSGHGAGDHIKDAGDSIKRNGLLLTAEAIVEGITNDYVEARMTLTLRSRR